MSLTAWRLCTLLACLLLPGCRSLPAQSVAITFDDLPAHSVLPPGVTREQVAADVLAALHAAHTPPVYGFVNGTDLQLHPEDAAVLRQWRAAGFPLGNHTWSHMDLNTHTAADFEADLLRNEPVLEPLAANTDWRWLRYPFLAEGDTPAKRDEVRQFLQQHGYRIAPVTMGFEDYSYNEPYARCLATHNTAAVTQLEQQYLTAASDDIAYRRANTHALFGHDIPYVLLMHIGAMDAHMLPRLLALYTAAGFHFISLETALADPFYANDLDPALPGAVDSLEAAMNARHLPLPKRPPTPASLATVCR